ncbi:hypothetical protein CAPTEDRAFT_217483 [Capitella teleta]|uniref:Uncharacterized protein n=1 Tax=Capitella teleta TaxID=283909 RepID=R7UNY5_CAPTE|nr:hypothetical protein CAPTEDRAFT_217483 [Capitella teleta]|eukprot:ELU05637.1 hypothetical protein CAPTEDRAFT_217483 [Capitella teleta]
MYACRRIATLGCNYVRIKLNKGSLMSMNVNTEQNVNEPVSLNSLQDEPYKVISVRDEVIGIQSAKDATGKIKFIHPSVEIDTQTRDMYLTSCRSDVYQSGVRFRDTSSVCEFSIIRKRNPIEYCAFEIVEFVFDSGYVIDSNTFIIVATEPLKYHFRCEAEISQENTFGKGTWIVVVHGHCLLETENWKLEDLVVDEENCTKQWNILLIEIHLAIVDL